MVEENLTKKYKARLLKLATDPIARAIHLKRQAAWNRKQLEDLEYRKKRLEQIRQSKLRQKYGMTNSYKKRTLIPIQMYKEDKPMVFTFD
jgi:hypothetical protein